MLQSLVPWQFREGCRRLIDFPRSRSARNRIGKINRAIDLNPKVGFGWVLDDGRPVHGGAVKLLPLKNEWGGDELRINILYSVSSSQPQCAETLFQRCRTEGIRIVWNQNGVGFPAWAGKESERFNAPMRKLRELADFVVYQSLFCKNSAERFLGPCAIPSEILYNPVNLQRFSPADQPAQSSPIRLLAAGTHGTRDRVISVLEMLSCLRKEGVESRLTVAGRFHWKKGEEDFQRQLKKLGIEEHVQRIKSFSQSDAPALYRAHDLLVHPKYMDPCPTVVIEALACGLPIVGSGSGGMPELVPADCGSLVLSPSDWDMSHAPSGAELAKAANNILPRLREMSSAARKHAETSYSVERWEASHRKIFQNLLR